jgi:hypothetical protein
VPYPYSFDGNCQLGPDALDVEESAALRAKTENQRDIVKKWDISKTPMRIEIY